MADREKMAYLEDRLKDLRIRFEWLEMQMSLMQKKIEMLEARLTNEIQTSSNEDSNEVNCSEKPNNSLDNDKKMKNAQICIALPPELLVYLKIMTKMRDLSYSEYVKGLIEDDLSKNIDIYKKALEIRNNL